MIVSRKQFVYMLGLLWRFVHNFNSKQRIKAKQAATRLEQICLGCCKALSSVLRKPASLFSASHRLSNSTKPRQSDVPYLCKYLSRALEQRSISRLNPRESLRHTIFAHSLPCVSGRFCKSASLLLHSAYLPWVFFTFESFERILLFFISASWYNGLHWLKQFWFLGNWDFAVTVTSQPSGLSYSTASPILQFLYWEIWISSEGHWVVLPCSAGLPQSSENKSSYFKQQLRVSDCKKVFVLSWRGTPTSISSRKYSLQDRAALLKPHFYLLVHKLPDQVLAGYSWSDAQVNFCDTGSIAQRHGISLHSSGHGGYGGWKKLIY